MPRQSLRQQMEAKEKRAETRKKNEARVKKEIKFVHPEPNPVKLATGVAWDMPRQEGGTVKSDITFLYEENPVFLGIMGRAPFVAYGDPHFLKRQYKGFAPATSRVARAMAAHFEYMAKVLEEMGK